MECVITVKIGEMFKDIRITKQVLKYIDDDLLVENMIKNEVVRVIKDLKKEVKK